MAIDDIFTEQEKAIIINSNNQARKKISGHPQRSFFIIIAKYDMLCKRLAACMHGSDVDYIARDVQKMKIGE